MNIPGFKLFYGGWSIHVSANETTNDSGQLYQAILDATGWSRIFLLVPIMNCTFPVYLTWYENIIYAHNLSGNVMQINFQYVAFGE